MPVNVIDPATDARTYGYQPRYLVLEDKAGRIRAGLPLFLVRSWLTGRRLVCLPFSDECWPLVASTDDASLLLGTARKILAEEGASYLEVRGWADGRPPDGSALVSHPYYRLHRLQMGNDPEEVRRTFSKKAVRYPIRKAERLEVAVHWAESEEDLRAFHRLDLITRRKHGAPPHPFQLFRNIHRLMATDGLAFLLLAEWEGKTVAGSLFFAFGDTLYYKYNASDARYLECQPNHLLLWKAIEHGCLNGYRHFDLGRSNPEHEGLRDFKRRWGAEEVELPYYYYPAVQGVGATEGSSVKFRAMRAVFRWLPAPLLKMSGTLLYRHLG